MMDGGEGEDRIADFDVLCTPLLLYLPSNARLKESKNQESLDELHSHMAFTTGEGLPFKTDSNIMTNACQITKE